MATVPNLPVIVSPTALRPYAFRIFTQRHGLSLTSSSLKLLAEAVSRHCGASWRSSGIAERLLDELAKQWKEENGSALVDYSPDDLAKFVPNDGTATSPKFNAQSSSVVRAQKDGSSSSVRSTERDHSVFLSQNDKECNQFAAFRDLGQDSTTRASSRSEFYFIDAFDDSWHSKRSLRSRKEPESFTTSLRTLHNRQRFELTRERILRSSAFRQSQSLPVKSFDKQSGAGYSDSMPKYQITQIANLLGRDGSAHVLFGFLARNSTGALILNDCTGSIALDLQYADSTQKQTSFLCPGMFAVIDGQYENVQNASKSSLLGDQGIGGSISGVFIVFSMTEPPIEKRQQKHRVGIDDLSSRKNTSSQNEIAVENPEPSKLLVGSISNKFMIILGAMHLDDAKTLSALKKIIVSYEAQTNAKCPEAIVFIGNFASHSKLNGDLSRDGSIEYKELFNKLASSLSEFSHYLKDTRLVLVPGDSDPWSSAYTSGMPACVPRGYIPAHLTSRLRKVTRGAAASTVAQDRRSVENYNDSNLISSTNPLKLRFSDTSDDLVIFRDDLTSRMRRNVIDCHGTDEDSLKQSAQTLNVVEGEISAPQTKSVEGSNNSHAIRVARTLLSQGTLSPFPPSQRPVDTNYAASLLLDPLPVGLILMDAELSPFDVRMNGCQVMNPGALLSCTKRGLAQWIHYDLGKRQGRLQELRCGP